MDKVLTKPQSSKCIQQNALCVKTMQISPAENGVTQVLSVHRECYEQLPIDVENGCFDSYDDAQLSRKTGPHLITCYCSSNLCNF